MTELDPVTSSVVRRLARRVARIEGQVRDQGRASQAQYRSVEGGAQEIYDEDDALRAVVGEQYDGAYTITTYGGDPPAAPSVPLVAQFAGGATITWDGFDVNDEAAWPTDLARVNVHLATVPGEPATLDTFIASIESPSGGAVSVAQPADVTTYCNLVAVTQAGVMSEPSPTAEVTGGAADGSGPTAPPAASPTLTASGSKDAITVVAEGVVDPTTILDYYIDGVLAESTRSAVYVFRTDAAGAPLELDTPYWFHVIARNVIGSAAASPTIEATLNAAVDSEKILAVVRAGFALLGAVTVGNITITPGTGVPGDVDYDPGGIVIPLSDGGEIRLPADGSDAVIDAILRTADAVVNGGLTINGVTNFLNGRLRLGSGVPNPAAAPAMGVTGYPVDARFPGTPADGDQQRGLAKSADGTRWAFVADEDLWIINSTTFAIAGHVPLGFASFVSADNEGFYPSSVATLGNQWYVLGQKFNVSGGEYQWRMQIYSITGGFVSGRWLESVAGSRLTTVSDFRDGAIAFDPDGLHFWVVRTLTSGKWRFYKYAVSGGAVAVSEVVTGDIGAYLTSGGLYVGNADLGASRFIVQGGVNNAYGAHAFDSTGTYVLADSWGSTWGYGLWWDGTQFWTLYADGTSTYLAKYSTSKVDYTVTAEYTWYDNNATGGNKESGGSPVATRTVPRRWWATVAIPVPPNVGGADQDAANAVKLYVGSGGTRRYLATFTTGLAQTYAIRTIPVSGPSTGTSTFAAASATGGIESLDGISYVRGDNSAYLPGTDTWHQVGGAGEPAYVSGWGGLAGELVYFRKNPMGDVHLVGKATPGTGTTVFVLPVGYRPIKKVADRIAKAQGSGNFVTVDVNTDGTVTVAGISTSTWASLTMVFSTA